MGGPSQGNAKVAMTRAGVLVCVACEVVQGEPVLPQALHKAGMDPPVPGQEEYHISLHL